MNGKFENIKMMRDTIETGRGKWYTNVNSYGEELGITWKALYKMSKEELKKEVRIYDTKVWEANLANKSTLKYYAIGKTRIGYEHCYRNDANSTYYAKARINSLKLEEAIGRGRRNYNRVCKLCGQGDEDIVHFLVECKSLEGKRDYNLLDRDIEDPEQRMIELLFRQEDHQGVGRMVKELWYRRKAIIKNKERMEIERKKRETIPIVAHGGRSDPGPMGKCQPPIRRRPRESVGARDGTQRSRPCRLDYFHIGLTGSHMGHTQVSTC